MPYILSTLGGLWVFRFRVLGLEAWDLGFGGLQILDLRLKFEGHSVGFERFGRFRVNLPTGSRLQKAISRTVHVCTHNSMHACMHACGVGGCVYIYICVYIYTIYIHIFTHTYS